MPTLIKFLKVEFIPNNFQHLIPKQLYPTEEMIEKHVPTQTYEALRRKYTDSCIKSLATTKKCGKCRQTIKRYTLYQCKFVMPQSKVEVAEKFE
jgi:hypothetical protein